MDSLSRFLRWVTGYHRKNQGLDDEPILDASQLDAKNSLALATVPVGDQPPSTTPTPVIGTTDSELPLVTAPSSNENATTISKLVQFLLYIQLYIIY